MKLKTLKDIEYINTDDILKEIREFKSRCFGDRPHSIVMNPEDIRYLESNIAFLPILENSRVKRIFNLIIIGNIKMEIGKFEINGIPRLQKW